MSNPVDNQIDDVPEFYFSIKTRETLTTAQNLTVDVIAEKTKPIVEKSISNLGVSEQLTKEIVDRSVNHVANLAKNNADRSIDTVERSVEKTNRYFSKCIIS